MSAPPPPTDVVVPKNAPLPPTATRTPSVQKPETTPSEAVAQPHQPGKLLGQGRQIAAMQEQLGAIQQGLSSIFDGTNKDLANLMNRYDTYTQSTKATQPFIDHLRHLVGLGGRDNQQSDGRWGDKTTQALISVGYIATSLSKLSNDLGAKGGQELQEAGKSLSDLVSQAEKDPANAERKYAPEIRVELVRLQNSMELIKRQAAEASQHLSSALETKMQQAKRSSDLEAMIYGGRDTGLKVSDPVLKNNNKPISFAALKDMVAFKAYLRQQGILGPQDAEGDNTHMRTIITSLIQQTDREIDELKHTALTLDQKGKKNYTTTGLGI